VEAKLDLRWAVVTGVIDHQAVQESFSRPDDLAIPLADRIYRRVDLQRQILQRGVWSKWRAVDQEQIYRILDNLPVRGAERIPRDARLDALVDPLPALTEGVWEGVDVERLLLNDANRIGVLMLRSFDFALERGETYRYRARLVFYTPPGARGPTRSPEFPGPWSEPTDGVRIR
jgi:hypothetical protein